MPDDLSPTERVSGTAKHQPSTVLIVGGNFDVVNGTASTNLSIEIAKGFQDHQRQATLIPLNKQTKRPGNLVHLGCSYRDIPYRFGHLRLLDRIPGPTSRPRAAVVIGALVLQLIDRKRRPEIIFCMTMWWWASLALSLIGRCFGIRVVYFLVEEPFALADMKRENQEHSLFQHWIAKINAVLIYRSIRCCDWVCCITSNLLTFARKQGVQDNRSSMLPNLLYQAQQIANPNVRTNSSHSTEPLKFVYSGRINFTRDEFVTLIDAVALLNEESDGALPAFELHIYGSGPAKDISALKAIIAEKKLDHLASYHGFVSSQELSRAQNAAFAFLLLKADIPQNQFNFPTKLMDYLKYQKPIIMTNIDTHRQYFTDGEDCIFVGAKDAVGLADKMKCLMTRIDEFDGIGAKASKKLDYEFSAASNIGELLDKLRLKSELKS